MKFKKNPGRKVRKVIKPTGKKGAPQQKKKPGAHAGVAPGATYIAMAAGLQVGMTDVAFKRKVFEELQSTGTIEGLKGSLRSRLVSVLQKHDPVRRCKLTSA